MKIVGFNIKCGGGQREETIVSALQAHAPDVIVLSEYQPGPSAVIVKRLEIAGWRHSALTDPGPRRGGVALFSKIPLERLPLPQELADFGHRYLTVALPELGLRVTGIYGPLWSEDYAAFWRGTLAVLAHEAATPHVVIGDFNTGASLLDAHNADYFCSEFFGQLSANGYTDLWRRANGLEARESTWFSSAGNGFRIDHAFGSVSLLAQVEQCYYSHAEREAGVSDRSALVVIL